MEISGKIIDVIKKRIYYGKLIIENKKIKNIISSHSDISGKYILPGFVDAHVHIESSMLTPTEFSRLAVRHGTVAVVTDPHEITNVLGVEGFRYMVEDARKALLKIKFGVPSCVPATNFETTGANIGEHEIEKLFQVEASYHLSEMMNFPGVINRNPEVMGKIEVAKRYNRKIDGHAPEISGRKLKKYVEAGITTDHECIRIEEAKEKIDLGMYILIREGSAAKNFEVLFPLIEEYPEKVMFCTDDSHPDDLAEKHINDMVKRSLKKGIGLWNVLQAATVNAVKYYDLDVGLLQPGDKADFIVCDHLEEMNINEVYVEGNKVFDKSTGVKPARKSLIINKFNCNEISEKALVVRAVNRKNIRVIGAKEDSLMTKTLIEKPMVQGNQVVSDLERDLLKIVVVNRFSPKKPVVGFVHGFGLKNGALASSIAHDSHNLIAVGTDDHSITGALNAVIREKGGIVVCHDGKEDILSLPVAGLMTTDDGETVADEYKELNQKAKETGTSLNAPFMTLSFMALLVIPELKISDRGLFDVTKFRFTDLFV